MTKLLLGCLGFVLCGLGMAQDKISPRMDINYTYVNGESPRVAVRVRKRIERRYYPIQGAQVKVYFNTTDASEEALIGEVITNGKGIGEMSFPQKFIAEWESLSEFDMHASIVPDDSLEEASELVTIQKARLEVEAEEDGDDRKVTALVERYSDGEWTPVEEVELKLFIKRDFGRIALGEDFYSTDADGAAETDFDVEVPGDENGAITIGAFVEEHDEFGSLFAYKNLNWGVATMDDNSEFDERTLWATRDKTPVWLLIFPNLIIIGVWGAIGYLVWQIFRIKKLAN